MATDTVKRNARDELIYSAKQEYGRDFDKLNAKEQSIAATKFYVRQIYNPVRTPIPDDELELGIVDGKNDLGCDLIHRDNGHVTIIQTKYRRRGTPETIEDVSHFLSIIERIRNPSLEPNRYLAEILSEIDWQRDNFDFVFLTFGDLRGQARKLCDQTPQYPKTPKDLEQRCQWQFLDNEDINISLRNVANLQKGSQFEKTIKIFPTGPRGQRGAQSTIEIMSGSYRSFILALDAKQLVEAYTQQGGDSIFSLNIRNYIGNTPINKEIANSAEYEANNFFLYNNGLSCLATKVEAEPDCLKVTGLQVINGAQTVRSLVLLTKSARRHERDIWNNSKPNVLVRITEIPEGYGPGGKVREKIIRANNTQNSIRDSDFRSNDEVQENLKKQFQNVTRKGRKAAYVPKRTDKAPANSEVIRMEEYAKAVYAFMYNPTDFSGNSSILYKNDGEEDGYPRVFGNGKEVWQRMPDDEFEFRAAIYWIAQEFGNFLRKFRDKQEDPDSRMALERKWLVLYAAKIVFQKRLKEGETLQGVVSRFHKGDWRLDGDDTQSKDIHNIFRMAAKGVIFSYKNAKKLNPTSFQHRNWMRGKNTTNDIKEAIDALFEYQTA